MAISAYTVLRSTTLDDLVNKVNTAIGEGYQPIGNLFQDSSGGYCQPAGIPVPEDDEEEPVE